MDAGIAALSAANAVETGDALFVTPAYMPITTARTTETAIAKPI